MPDNCAPENAAATADRLSLPGRFQACHGGTVVVLGGVMLDHWIDCAVERISPEAPVPVARVLSRRTTLGGAANAAACCAKLGATVRLVAPHGDDNDSRCAEWHDLIRLAGVDEQYMLRFLGRSMTHKKRFRAAGQQLLRVDDDVRYEWPPATLDMLWSQLVVALETADVCYLADYLHQQLPDAFVRKVAEHIDGLSCYAMADPGKGVARKRYEGWDLVVPNRAEFEGWLGNDLGPGFEVYDQAILITQDRDGMLLLNDIGEECALFGERFPAHVSEVADVCGAGDVAAATVAFCMAHRMPLHDAAYVANVAAGLSVQHRGTYMPSKDEIRKALIASVTRREDVR